MFGVRNSQLDSAIVRATCGKSSAVLCFNAMHSTQFSTPLSLPKENPVAGNKREK